MRFNINSPVRVRLTAKGRDHLRSAYNAINVNLRWVGKTCNILSLTEQKPSLLNQLKSDLPEEDGWSDWQLWALMQAFGPCIGPGFDLMFEAEIEIVEADQVND